MQADRIYCGDALTVLKTLPDNSVNCCVKSNRAKYCPDCAARVHRRQKTESERKRRSCVDS